MKLDRASRILVSKLRWVRGTALGKDSVPLVKSTTAVSAAVTRSRLRHENRARIAAESFSVQRIVPAIVSSGTKRSPSSVELNPLSG